MVAPIGIGKAATTVTEGASKLGAKAAKGSTGDAALGHGSFEQKLQQPGPASPAADATKAATAATGAAGASGAAAPVAQAGTAQAGATQAVGPGDKILGGIDKMRGEAGQLIQQVGQISGGQGGQVNGMLSMQASLMGFEVTTQVGSKGVQETSQAVQTLLKGQ